MVRLRKFGKSLFFLLLISALQACSEMQTESDPSDETEASLSSEEAATDEVPADASQGELITEEDSLASGEPVADNNLPGEPPAEMPPSDTIAPPPESLPGSELATTEPPPNPDPAATAMPPPEAAPATTEVPPVVAAETPAAATPPSESAAGELTEYTVRNGDFLMKIAFENYGDLSAWKKIYEANQTTLANPNTLQPGVILKLPQPLQPAASTANGQPYLIHKGDTLGTIAQSVYGNPKLWRKVYENNPALIKDPNKIYAGFTIYTVPDPQGQTLGANPGTEITPNRSVASAPEPPAQAPPATEPPAIESPPSAEAAPAVAEDRFQN